MLDIPYHKFVTNAPGKFFVYVDWTTEEVKRAYYVGKGNLGRLLGFNRNKFHSYVKSRFGLKREIALITNDEELALDYEIYLIALHNTFHHDNINPIACNFTRGGEGISGLIHNPETRKILSEKCSGRKHTVEERLKQSNAQLGKKMSDINKLNRSLNRKDKKPIKQCTLDGTLIKVYDSVKQAKKEYGGSISSCLGGNAKQAYGFVWSYVQD